MAFVHTNSEHSRHSSDKKRQASKYVMTTMATILEGCAKHATRLSKKLNKMRKPSKPIKKLRAAPKQLLNSISNKAMNLVDQYHKKKNNNIASEEAWGDGGVWQRSILMGDKCQPLDFSGVIYYDDHGKRLTEVPLRSPRASPLPGYLQRIYVN